MNDLQARFNPGGLEVGDEIGLAGTARYLTNFSFEYWGTNGTGDPYFAGNVEARIRFYRNDGPPFNGYAAPGSVLYDSGWFPVPGPTPRSTLVFVAGSDFPAEGLFLPVSELTWSVQFQGMAPSDSLGVDLFSPPALGYDFTDYWQKDEGWSLKTNLVSMDFAARMEASEAPRPGPTLQIAAAGGQLWITWPASATNFVLESSSRLGPLASWSPITNGISVSGYSFVLTTNLAAVPASFYRLRQQ